MRELTRQEWLRVCAGLTCLNQNEDWGSPEALALRAEIEADIGYKPPSIPGVGPPLNEADRPQVDASWSARMARLANLPADSTPARGESENTDRKDHMDTKYVLFAEGVYMAGIVGVYASLDDARKAAEEVWLQTDGYHTLVIKPFEVGKTYEKTFPYTGRVKTAGPLNLEIESL